MGARRDRPAASRPRAHLDRRLRRRRPGARRPAVARGSRGPLAVPRVRRRRRALAPAPREAASSGRRIRARRDAGRRLHDELPSRQPRWRRSACLADRPGAAPRRARDGDRRPALPLRMRRDPRLGSMPFADPPAELVGGLAVATARSEPLAGGNRRDRPRTACTPGRSRLVDMAAEVADAARRRSDDLGDRRGDAPRARVPGAGRPRGVAAVGGAPLDVSYAAIAVITRRALLTACRSRWGPSACGGRLRRRPRRRRHRRRRRDDAHSWPAPRTSSPPPPRRDARHAEAPRGGRDRLTLLGECAR